MKSLQELYNLKNRVAIITGGGGHIGYAIAEALAELGSRIVLVDNAPGAAEKAKDILTKKYPVECLALNIDLSSEEQVRSIPNLVSKEFNRIDIVVNNAALAGSTDLLGWAVPFEQQRTDTFNKALNVNLSTPFTLVQSCAPYLEASGHGSVINVSSIYGMVGPDMSLYEETKMGNPAAYAASKGGLIQLTRWLSTVLSPKIRINCISPGGVFRNQPEEFVNRYIEKTPLKRMAVEEDFKGVAAFLASDASQYITGQNIMVDGGWTAW